jgi:hypothetical protein
MSFGPRARFRASERDKYSSFPCWLNTGPCSKVTTCPGILRRYCGAMHPQPCPLIPASPVLLGQVVLHRQFWQHARHSGQHRHRRPDTVLGAARRHVQGSQRQTYKGVHCAALLSTGAHGSIDRGSSFVVDDAREPASSKRVLRLGGPGGLFPPHHSYAAGQHRRNPRRGHNERHGHRHQGAAPRHAQGGAAAHEDAVYSQGMQITINIGRTRVCGRRGVQFRYS